MEKYSHEHVNFYYRSLIPKKFWRRLSIEQFTPLILYPHGPFSQYRADDGQIRTIPPSAVCSIRYGDDIWHIFIPKDIAPLLFAAVLLVGEIFNTTNRVQRYINLFKSYECIVENRRIEFSAIRHGLSHPGAKLTRKSTIDTLKAIFGSTEIDLDNYYHLKEFYYYFGLLLIENDAKLHSLLIKNLPKAKEIVRGNFLIQSNAM